MNNIIIFLTKLKNIHKNVQMHKVKQKNNNKKMKIYQNKLWIEIINLKQSNKIFNK